MVRRACLHYALVSAALSLAGWLLFIVAFDTRFPHGPFETLHGGDLRMIEGGLFPGRCWLTRSRCGG